MRMELYIAQLLYRYQCVTVPGFGAFLAENQSAQYFESTNTFYPPKKSISFNYHLKNNDGLLASHMMHMEKVSYERAVEMIQEEVAQWKQTLFTERTISFKNIGKIYLNVEDNYVFESVETANYLVSSFGLTSFVSPVIKREILQFETESITDDSSEVVIENDSSEVTTPVIPMKPRSFAWLKYAAVFVVGCGALGIYGAKWHENKVAQETLLVEKAVQKQIENKIQEATFFIENPLPIVTLNVTKAEVVMNYHIVAGAFKEEKNALKAVHQLESLGYKAKVAQRNNHGLLPVLYGSYATMADAQEAMKKIRDQHNKEAWMLVKEM
jgi:hypothetical protein